MKRMTNKERRRRRFVNHIRNTWMNKVGALALISCGIVVTGIDYDATALVFISMFAIPMFFAKKQVIF